MIKIEAGKCPYCQKQVWEMDQHNNHKRLKDYGEFWIALSDGSRMKVNICKTCRKKLTNKMVSDLMKVHKEFWINGIEETINKTIVELQQKKTSQINYYSTLDSVKHGLTERDLE